MSRTYRNIEYCRYFTRPKTQKYRKDLHSTKKEILEVLGPNYLAGNTKDYKQIITGWDDKQVAAQNEALNFAYYIERIFENQVKKLYGELPEWLKINFNKKKNRIELGRYSWYFNRGQMNHAAYLPFVLKHKKYNYPILIIEHYWF
jgi:hypothetical protein